MVILCYMENTGTSQFQPLSKTCVSRLQKSAVTAGWASYGELFDLENPEASHLCYLVTLLKAKQERKDFELMDKNPIASHSGYIVDIGLDYNKKLSDSRIWKKRIHPNAVLYTVCAIVCYIFFILRQFSKSKVSLDSLYILAFETQSPSPVCS